MSAVRQILTRETAGPPKSRLGRWMLGGSRMDARVHSAGEKRHPWYEVLWLTGVDYFSTLGYQPGIALLAAGAISPIATSILVLVTLACALPIYAQVARRSYVGQGSLALLENLLPGWSGKVLVLMLLGFAGTDFVITMTLSAADAAQHAVENPFLRPILGESRLGIALGLLTLLALVFLMGFNEAIHLAVAVAIPYLALNLAVIIRSSWEILHRPELFHQWRASLALHGDWTGLMFVGALVFPKLALGLSGFETGVSVMPLVSGEANQSLNQSPLRRIRNTRKLLAAAALIMSVMLIASSFVTTLLIPARRVPDRRRCQRPGDRVSCAPSAGRRVRNGLRSVEYSDSVVCRCLRYGRTAAPDSALSSTVRNGASLGGLRASVGAGIARDRCGGYDVLPCGRRGPGRRIRYRSSCPHAFCCSGRRAGAVAREPAIGEPVLLAGKHRLSLYSRRQRLRAAGRNHHRQHLHYRRYRLQRRQPLSTSHGTARD